MVRSQANRAARAGVAIVEFAILIPVLLILLVGVWEVGRMVQVQQILSNAAREGGRIAAQGLIINKTSTPTQIQVSTGDPNVKQTVLYYLTQAGIDTTNVQVDFKFVSGDTSKTQPYEATKGQQFEVKVTLPYQNFAWTGVGFFAQTQMTATVVWASVVDDPFTLDVTLPTWYQP